MKNNHPRENNEVTDPGDQVKREDQGDQGDSG